MTVHFKTKHFVIYLKYAISMVQENQVGLKLNGTYERLAHADDVKLRGQNMDIKNSNFN
jgi:hypothetical protein